MWTAYTLQVSHPLDEPQPTMSNIGGTVLQVMYMSTVSSCCLSVAILTAYQTKGDIESVSLVAVMASKV